MQFPATLVQMAEKPPPAFHKIPSSHHTCRIPMLPILQIHTLIPPIWISSLGYQLCQLFKILTYIEVQDTGQQPIMVQVEDLVAIHYHATLVQLAKIMIPENIPAITITATWYCEHLKCHQTYSIIYAYIMQLSSNCGISWHKAPPSSSYTFGNF